VTACTTAILCKTTKHHRHQGKRPRTDDDPKKTKLNVRQHFTRIYIKVSKEAAGSSKSKKDGKKLIYAVCNYCDKVFKADSKQGTSHHGRHAESCLRKQALAAKLKQELQARYTRRVQKLWRMWERDALCLSNLDERFVFIILLLDELYGMMMN
jgi:hypothetical protein